MSDLNQSQQIDEPFDLEREPLDKPQQPFEIDWGGDGSDLERPVRAHVLAALQPSTGSYEPPLDTLLSLGDIAPEVLEQRAAERGIGQEHVPELVRMVRNRALATAEGDNPASWAPMHALHLLQSLDISTVVAELIPLFDLDFDRLTDELIDIVATAGVSALPPTAAYVRDRTRWAWGRSRASDILQKIAEQHPETREQVISILSEILADAENDHEQAVTGAMSALIGLKAIETLPLIRRAFELHKIDETMYGPWGEVLKEIGVEPELDDPLIEESRQRFEEKHHQMFPQSLRDSLDSFQERHRAQQTLAEQRAAVRKRNQDRVRNQKNKRKTANASRKANRKKRK
jgi:hypothetical protein